MFTYKILHGRCQSVLKEWRYGPIKGVITDIDYGNSRFASYRTMDDFRAYTCGWARLLYELAEDGAWFVSTMATRQDLEASVIMG